MSALVYTLFVLAVGVERLAEMVVSTRHARWAMARGGVETGRGHYPVMVVLHTALLAGCVAEVWLAPRQFTPAPGWTMAALVLACQGVRWWCIAALGPRWNTRVIVVPGLPLVTSGPYRYLSHPNYAVVVVEGAALPLVHGAWLTAAVFTVANAALLTVRLRAERRALRWAAREVPA
ncbi:isoprenylcysteine carboxyl methyltransferase family protein [Pseudonocardia lacus]|uniref:isoprenylcysteine carboxyl methyltransferase family protein n=1 Tax=Pseudonocardia lacus TaxID=2835865 RepID=UPI001BDC5CAF|nr:isoprenylcysteine carboxylmethyltransferase family protein [Pseudonocardia lacus]